MACAVETKYFAPILENCAQTESTKDFAPILGNYVDISLLPAEAPVHLLALTSTKRDGKLSDICPTSVRAIKIVVRLIKLSF